MLNKIIVIGHVGQKPEVKTLASGRLMATLSVATSRQWRDKDSGERKQKTQWHRIVCFNEGLCKIIDQYVDKGSKLYVEGELWSRPWTDKDGIKREAFEIVLEAFRSQLVLLDRASGDRAPAASSEEDFGKVPDQPAGDPGPSGAAKTRADMDDEIPF